MKRIFFWIAGGILLLVLALSVVYGFRQELIAPYIENRLISAIESHYGVKISIGEIGGTFVTNLKLGKVETVETVRKGPVTRIAFTRVEVHYWLPDLFGGVQNFVGNMNITLDGARAKLNLDRLTEGEKSKSGHPTALPVSTDLPHLRVSDSRLDVQVRGLHIDLADLNVDLQPPKSKAANSARLEMRATATITDPKIKKQTGHLNALLTYNRKQLTLDRLNFAGQPLIRHATLDLRGRKEGILALQAALHLFGGEANLQLRLVKAAVDGRAHLDGIDLHALSSFLTIPGLSSFGGTLIGNAQLKVDLGNVAETLGGELDMRIEKGRFQQIAANSFRLEAKAGNGRILIQSFSARLGSNRLAVEAADIPTPALLNRQWSRLLVDSSGTFSLQFDDIPDLLTGMGMQRSNMLERVPKHHLELAGKIDNGSLSISRGLLQTKTGIVKIRTAHFDLPPQATDWSRTTMMAEATINMPKLSEVGAVFGIPGLQGSMSGDIDVSGALGAPKGRATVTGTNLVFQSTTLGNLQFAAVADHRRVQVKTLTMKRASDFVRGHGTLYLDSCRIENVGLDFSLAAVEHFANLLPHKLQIAGKLTGSVTAEGACKEPTTTVRATLDSGKISSLVVPSAKVDIKGHGRAIDIDEAKLMTQYGSVALAGTIDRGPKNRRFVASLRSLHLTTSTGDDMQLVAPTTLSFSLEGVLAAKDLDLRGDLGDIYVDGSMGRHVKSALKVRVADLTSRDWLSQLSGKKLSFSGLNAELSFSGTLAEPSSQASGQVEAIHLSDLPFPVRGDFDLTFGSRGLKISRLELKGANDLELSLKGSLPVNPWRKDMFLPGDLSLVGRIDLPSLKLLTALTGKDADFKGALGGDLRLTGTWADPKGHLQLQGWGLRIEHADIPAPPKPMDLTANVTISRDELRLLALRVASPNINFTASGQWSGTPSLRDILRGRGLRPIGNLDFRGKLQMPEIAWLARGSAPIRQLAGALQANLTVSGPAREPKVDGTIRVSDGVLRTTTWGIPPIEDLSISAELSGRRLILQEARGKLGSAPFSLAGSIGRNEGKTVFNLALQGSNLLFFRDERMMLRANSNIHITGPLAKLAVSGQLAITEGYYQRNVEFLNILKGGPERPKPITGGLQPFSIRSGPLSAMTFDVKIGAKNPFRITNNVAKAQVRPELTLSGTGELPVLLGKIYVDESTIILPTTRLQVESGLVRFPKSPPNSPFVNLLAETKMAGYDISVQIEGNYSKPVVTLSSVPPLSHEDLLLLLLTGRLPAEGGARETAQAGGINIAVYVGKGLLAKWFGGGSASKESLLDRLQVQMGQGVSQTGQETLDARLELTKDLLKKKDTLYLTAERDVYDDYNIGLKIVFQFK